VGLKKGLHEIVESDLQELTTFVHGNVLRAVCDSSSASLVFRPASVAERIKVSGLCVQPCNPEVQVDEEGRATWTIPVEALDMLLGAFWETSSLERSRLRSLAAASVYMDAAGRTLLIADGTESHTPVVQGKPPPKSPPDAAAAAATNVTCELCTHPVARDMMRHHMGAHLLQPSWSLYDAEKPRMPCGLCGVRASAGQKLLVSSPGLCGVSLAKTSKGKPAQSVNQCQLLGALEYSMGPAATCRVSTPCTNRPMKCSKCEVVIYSYSMRQHFADQHPTAMIPEDVES
jgi:hypothetical protein